MKRSMLLISVILLIGLASCQQEINTRDSPSDLTAFLQKQDEIHTFYIVENDSDMLIAVQLHSFSRFRKDSLEKKLEKNVEHDYTDKSVTVSADYKILYELKHANRDNTKHLPKLLKLLKEET